MTLMDEHNILRTQQEYFVATALCTLMHKKIFCVKTQQCLKESYLRSSRTSSHCWSLLTVPVALRWKYSITFCRWNVSILNICSIISMATPCFRVIQSWRGPSYDDSYKVVLSKLELFLKNVRLLLFIIPISVGTDSYAKAGIWSEIHGSCLLKHILFNRGQAFE